MGEWKEYILEDCMDAIIDYRGKTPNKTTSGIPLITAKIIKNGSILPTQEYIAENDYESWMRRGIPEVGDVLLTTEAPLGEVAQISDPNIALAQRVITLRGKKEFLNNDFLKYLLISPQTQSELAGRSSGTTVLGIKQSELRKVKLIIPEYPIQAKIAGILKSLDDKIELNRKMNETLEEMARAIFKSWFVDFDPVHAKSRGEKPAGMPDEIAALFPSEFVHSDQLNKPIPKGWNVKPIGEISELLNGFAFKSADYTQEGTFVLRTKNFSNVGSVERLNDDVYLPSIFLETHSKYLCQEFDFFVVMVGASIGKTSKIFSNCLPALRNQNMWCFRPKKYFTARFFINCYAETLIAKNTQIASGSARDFFRKDYFKKLPLIVPKEKVLHAFEQQVCYMYEKIGNNLGEITSLIALRDSLLPKLISGEIKV
jgi:type I restriction enzyme S subunit